MLVAKGYQTYPPLQAFPNTTITVQKVFLFIVQRLKENPLAVITVEMIASALGVCAKTVSNATNELQKKHGLLTKSRRKGFWNDVNRYVITKQGRQLIPALINSYKVFCGIFKRPLLSFGLLLSLSPSSFPLYKEDIYIYPPLKRELLTHARVKRVEMSTPIDAKEMLATQDLLSLSKWGMIRLSAYPRQAIEHAYLAFRNSKSKKDDPFRWFCSLCDEWCRKQNAEPNLPFMRRLAVEHSMPMNPEWLIPRPVLAIPAKNKHVANERRTAMSEEEGFIHRIHALDKLGQMSELNEFARIIQTNLSKQVEPFLDKPVEAPIKKVVTELKDQIVCAQIANDEVVWGNLKYSPIDGDELYEEVYT